MSQIIKLCGHRIGMRVLFFNANFTSLTQTYLTTRTSVLALKNIACYSTEKGSKGNLLKGVEVKSELNSETAGGTKQLSQKARLKQAVRDYGATIIVFHVTIALASLGLCYIAISNGVDAVKLLSYLGFSESVVSSKIATEGSTFVIAYAVHKMFAPVRIGITLSSAPFIVRYLRKINWIKPPKN